MHISVKSIFDRNIYAVFVSLFLFGYPVFSILSTVLKQDELTIVYRFLCIFFGGIVLFTNILNKRKRASFSRVQLIILFWHLVYILWVIFYFANGYQNDVLDLSFYINNSILFSFFPILFLVKDVDNDSLMIIKKYLKASVIIFLVLTYLSFFYGLSDDYRLSFEKLNPISLSIYSSISIIFSFWAFKSKFIAIIIFMLFLFLMVLTGSRGPLLSLFVVLFSFAFFNSKLKTKIQLGIFISLLASLFAIFYTSLVRYIPILSRFDFNTKEGGLSVNIREVQYNSALSIFYEHPILGGGLVEPITGYYPHNIFLELLMSGGVVLFFIYMIVIIFMVNENIIAIRNGIPKCFPLVFFFLLLSYMFTSSVASIGLLYFIVVLISKYNNGISNDKHYHY